MHIDLNLLETTIVTPKPFCIVGAGIAGLVLAQRLAKMGFEINLLEAGGLQMEERSQSLYQAEMAAAHHAGSTLGRFRTFGGSSTQWGGQLLPYPQDVFKPVAGSPSTAWPIDGSDIEPYYDEVQRILQVGSLPFTDALLPALGHRPTPFSEDIRLRFSKWAPFSKRNLAQTIGRDCIADRRIHLYTHANVAELFAIKDGAAKGRVTHARVVDYRGRSFDFSADHFVVAAGTIESARILLSSPTIPNEHDQLGRYFHDHVSFPAAVVPAPARQEIVERLGPFFVDGVLHTCKLEASTALQQQRGLLSVMAHFVIEEPQDSGIAAVRNMLVSVQQGKLRQALTQNLAPMLHGAGDVVRLAWASKVKKRRAIGKHAVMRMNIDMEQPGNASNRILISQTRDELGLPKAVIDWRVGEAEYESAARFAQIVKDSLEAAGFAPLEWMPGVLEGAEPEMMDTYHAMGGLRMGTDARKSVVDRELKVHGLGNVHVASCAVFPSGGSSNPTFTMMALTMQLADRLGAISR
jgi:choline dehydrogenase-like flavoprotein